MSQKLREVTTYFRKALASHSKQKIDFKSGEFIECSYEDLERGKLDEAIFNSLSKKANSQKTSIEVIIAAKTIKTNFDEQIKRSTDIDELTGIYFIPAILNKDGSLTFNNVNKSPWFPREFLEPNIDSVLAIGKSAKMDKFLSDKTAERYKIKTWENYLKFAKKLYSCTTETDFKEKTVNGEELEDKVYIFNDDTINATQGIIDLYDHMLKNSDENGSLREDVKLYEKLTSLEETDTEELITNDLIQMKKHSGQMGGEYPLSPSQRECINHFVNTTDGEVLAVNGPPGTGKTTLLQSIVADLVVKRALNNQAPPIIVATSTNNQAVTNIIESFGSIKKAGLKNLEKRWIEGVNSFATYFPSQQKEKDATKEGFQYTNQLGHHFFEQVNSSENIKKSQDYYIENVNVFFDSDYTNVKQCGERIHSELQRAESVKKSLLDIIFRYNEYRDDVSLLEYLEILGKENERLEEDFNKLKNRLKQWDTYYKSIPFIFRWLDFIPYFKKKIVLENKLFIEPTEDFLQDSMSMEQIKEEYSKLIVEQRNKITEKQKVIEEFNSLYKQIQDELDKLELYFDREYFNKIKNISNVNALNDELDKSLRYVEFWLAVHHFEYLWLKGKYKEWGYQKNKTFKDCLQQRFRRLAMLSPCFVMTFYQLPKNFRYYCSEGSEKHGYLYNYIDLLIVDEAGQVTLEVAACSFSLAKNSLVVGDVHQIEPVWNVKTPLDKALAIESGVINNQSEFIKLKNAGVNTSQSSIMKMAATSCKYKKFDNRGLFLSEHRRCYDEIIDFCNQLVYNGKLEPKRGEGRKDLNFKLKNVPHMGHKQVNTQLSNKKSGSRYNSEEAKEIVQWIDKNIDSIQEHYKDENPKDLVGVITPFKAQEIYISKFIKKYKPKLAKLITIGTVHKFQGGERKIIILSTVYGSQEKCHFIDANKSMLNVAVSRAKDSFLVFGDLNCLNNNEEKTSGLLKKAVTDNN
ncbi:AAA domain-containing protein [Proteinivorax hydrogeniformans]|uniref:AAA domain-containing protein n=1 Tax=Proteinivorax hydrogeniformans TaxID=1826727 RepID=A0AAU8HUE7_9FIRM